MGTGTESHASIEIDDRGTSGCFEVVTLPEWNPVQLAIAPWLDEFFIRVLPIGIFDDGFGKGLWQFRELDTQLRESRMCDLGVGKNAEHFVGIVDLFLHDTPVGRFDFVEVAVKKVSHFVGNKGAEFELCAHGNVC